MTLAAPFGKAELSANCSLSPKVRLIPITLKSLLTYFGNRLKREKSLKDRKDYPAALLLVYGPVYFNLPDTSLVDILGSGEDAPQKLLHVNKKVPVQLLSALLEHGAALDTEDRVGEVLLAYACICDDAQTIKVLLKHHVDVNAQGGVGFPPLMCTADYECARLLLESGVDANACDSNGRTRLMYIQNTKLYPLLLEHHADLNAQDEEGCTALIHLFVSLYLDDDHIHAGMRFLLQHGAKASLKDKHGKTALDYAKDGKANWMVAGDAKGGYDNESIQ